MNEADLRPHICRLSVLHKIDLGDRYQISESISVVVLALQNMSQWHRHTTKMFCKSLLPGIVFQMTRRSWQTALFLHITRFFWQDHNFLLTLVIVSRFLDDMAIQHSLLERLNLNQWDAETQKAQQQLYDLVRYTSDVYVTKLYDGRCTVGVQADILKIWNYLFKFLAHTDGINEKSTTTTNNWKHLFMVKI